MLKKITRPKVRRYLYGVTAAALGVAVALRVVDPEVAPVIGVLLVALFNVPGEPPADAEQ